MDASLIKTLGTALSLWRRHIVLRRDDPRERRGFVFALHWLVFPLVLLAIGAKGEVAPLKSDAPSLKIIQEARLIVARIKESHYSHKTHVDEAAGVYDVDCSGLLCHILRKVAPEQLAAVPRSGDDGRPLALQFHDTFSAASAEPAGTGGWRQIASMGQARPGDVFVWRVAAPEAGKDTGHVMIVDQEPVDEGGNTYRVRVIDSALSPHGDDTRAEGTQGVGRGTMWFLVDNAGRPTGYRWKLRNGKLHEMTVSIGRAVQGR